MPSVFTYKPGQSTLFRPVLQAGRNIRGLRGRSILWTLLVLVAWVRPALAVPPGTLISNSAQVTYGLGSQSDLTTPSNTVNHTTVTLRTSSSATLMQYTSANANRPPDPPNRPVDPSELSPARVFQQDDIVFIYVEDDDHNIDAASTENVWVTFSVNTTGDEEILQIAETGPDTGRFIGYITTTPSNGQAVSGDALLTVSSASQIICEYVDSADPTDRSSATALVDPYGLVFDSSTGLPVDGAQITLIDMVSGQPATVFGDDGVSTYPSTVTSGASVTDSSGQVYNLPPGCYRFPIVAPGTYRLAVAPPAAYAAPSTVPTAELQNLPNAPFVIAEPGSRGEPFTLNPGPALRVDIPIDPRSASFWLTKNANRNQVTVGDYVQYTLEVENLTASTIAGITLTDQLPAGFRYQPQSIRIDGLPAAEPVISSNGRTLNFNLADMASGGRASIRYVTAVGAGARMGEAVNTAVVQSIGGDSSNTARATVQVTETLFRNTSFIVGRVAVPEPSDISDNNKNGLQGVRIYLEDGTYAVTDREGRFHFEGVKPGVHVVQLDKESLPEHYLLLSAENNTRAAGRNFSQFVDLAPGTLWRTDFFVAPEPPIQGHAVIELNSSVSGNIITYEALLKGNDVPLRNRRLAIMLPPGADYIQDSSQIDQDVTSNPRITGEVLTYDLGRAQGAWETRAAFSVNVAACPVGELVTKAVLSFDTPTQKRQQTPVVENVAVHTIEEQHLSQDEINIQLQPDTRLVEGMNNFLIAITEQSTIQHPTIVLNPRFDVFSAQLGQNDKAKIRQLARKLLGLDIQQIVINGHSDATPIRAEKRKVYADNYALSLARAQSVAHQLIQTSNLPSDTIGVFGKGPDEPVADNASAIGRALNRRVTVEIYSKELLRKNSMQQIPPLSQEISTPDQLSAREKSILNELTRQLKGAKVIHIQLAYLLKSTTAETPDNISVKPMARAQQIGNYLVRSLGLDDSQITLVGKSAEEREFEAQSDNDRLWDYRVDVRVHTQKIKRVAHLQTIKSQDHGQAVTSGLYPGQVWEKDSAKEASPEPIANPYNKEWLEKARPDLQWLLPAAGTIPALPSTKIAVLHPAQGKLTLMLNGRPVNPLNFEGTELDRTKTKAISRWNGVDLVAGDNLFELFFKDNQGDTHQRITHEIHYPGPPVEAELVAQQSRLIADGKRPPVVAIRLKDKAGQPVRPGVTGEFTVAPPFAALDTANRQKQQPLTMAGPPKAQYIVKEDGIALLELQPTVQSGEAVLNLRLIDGDHTIRCWLQPNLRDWILVGLAEGTAGYNTLSGNMENLAAADQEEDLYQDGRIAFFAKGQIKGAWLLTLAYNSAKDRKDAQNRLFQTIDPNTYYTLYGDDVQQGYEAASIRKLYVKIEREQFYALFGDYDTGLTVTELSRYSRRLNGLKTELQNERFNINAFASETDQAFVKDEIRGDGTSGLYNLSRSSIVINSEKIHIETRDRFRSETIIATQTLTRHIDYNIDYDDGTLFFKFPVYSRDKNLNPTYIIAEYETTDGSEQAYTYGGRAAAKAFGQKMEVGASYIHEGPDNGTAELAGVDATIQLGSGMALKAEMATSNTETAGSRTDGQALLVELTKFSGNLDAKAYFREQQEGFGLGQQNGSEAATRKLGLDLGYCISDSLRFNGQMLRQHNLATDAERDLDEASVAYIKDRYSLRTGLRLNEDRLGDGTVRRSELLTAGGSLKCFDRRLQLRLDHEQEIGNETVNADFPSRTILGADYRINDGLTLFGTQEFLWDDQETGQNTRVGMKAAPWQGGQISSDIQQNLSESGQRLLANLGLYQTWQLSPRWRLDGGLDRAQTIDAGGQGQFNTNVPSTSGANEDFTAISLGIGYNADKWSWTSRIETRYADTRKKWQMRTGIAGEPRHGLGLAAGLTLSQTQDDATGRSNSGDVNLSLALRPARSAWTVLDRLEYIFDSDDANTTENRRLVNNFNANYKAHRNLQVSLQYGAKYVMDTFDSQNYSGFVDLIGLEARYDLNAKWDVGLRGGVLHAWQMGQMGYSCGLSLGHSFAKNTWISVGYNIMGFEDEDFSRAAYTAKGPFVQFRLKFDQQTVREILTQWKN